VLVLLYFLFYFVFQKVSTTQMTKQTAANAIALEDFLADRAEIRKRLGLTMPLAAEVSGPKYVRVYSLSGSSRSALFFINRQTGEVFESASWKQPKRWSIAGLRVTVTI
jgi:hypothetical protein